MEKTRLTRDLKDPIQTPANADPSPEFCMATVYGTQVLPAVKNILYKMKKVGTFRRCLKSHGETIPVKKT